MPACKSASPSLTSRRPRRDAAREKRIEARIERNSLGCSLSRAVVSDSIARCRPSARAAAVPWRRATASRALPAAQ